MNPSMTEEQYLPQSSLLAALVARSRGEPFFTEKGRASAYDLAMLKVHLQGRWLGRARHGQKFHVLVTPETLQSLCREQIIPSSRRRAEFEFDVLERVCLRCARRL